MFTHFFLFMYAYDMNETLRRTTVHGGYLPIVFHSVVWRRFPPSSVGTSGPTELSHRFCRVKGSVVRFQRVAAALKAVSNPAFREKTAHDPSREKQNGRHKKLLPG